MNNYLKRVNSLPTDFPCIFSRLLIFFKINFFENFFQGYLQSVKQFGHIVQPKPGSKLFVKAISRLTALAGSRSV